MSEEKEKEKNNKQKFLIIHSSDFIPKAFLFNCFYTNKQFLLKIILSKKNSEDENFVFEVKMPLKKVNLAISFPLFDYTDFSLNIKSQTHNFNIENILETENILNKREVKFKNKENIPFEGIISFSVRTNPYYILLEENNYENTKEVYELYEKEMVTKITKNLYLLNYKNIDYSKFANRNYLYALTTDFYFNKYRHLKLRNLDLKAIKESLQLNNLKNKNYSTCISDPNEFNFSQIAHTGIYINKVEKIITHKSLDIQKMKDFDRLMTFEISTVPTKLVFKREAVFIYFYFIFFENQNSKNNRNKYFVEFKDEVVQDMGSLFKHFIYLVLEEMKKSNKLYFDGEYHKFIDSCNNFTENTKNCDCFECFKEADDVKIEISEKEELICEKIINLKTIKNHIKLENITIFIRINESKKDYKYNTKEYIKEYKKEYKKKEYKNKENLIKTMTHFMCKPEITEIKDSKKIKFVKLFKKLKIENQKKFMFTIFRMINFKDHENFVSNFNNMKIDMNLVDLLNFYEYYFLFAEILSLSLIHNVSLSVNFRYFFYGMILGRMDNYLNLQDKMFIKLMRDLPDKIAVKDIEDIENDEKEELIYLKEILESEFFRNIRYRGEFISKGDFINLIIYEIYYFSDKKVIDIFYEQLKNCLDIEREKIDYYSLDNEVIYFREDMRMIPFKHFDEKFSIKSNNSDINNIRNMNINSLKDYDIYYEDIIQILFLVKINSLKFEYSDLIKMISFEGDIQNKAVIIELLRILKRWCDMESNLNKNEKLAKFFVFVIGSLPKRDDKIILKVSSSKKGSFSFRAANCFNTLFITDSEEERFLSRMEEILVECIYSATTFTIA